LLLLLPDKRRKKFTKALNPNKPYPHKPSLAHHTIPVVRKTYAVCIPDTRMKSCGPLAGPARAGQKGVRLKVAQRRLKISAIPYIQSHSTSGLKFFSAGRPICPMPASRAGKRLAREGIFASFVAGQKKKKNPRKRAITIKPIPTNQV
jgi:hypothetical protein